MMSVVGSSTFGAWPWPSNSRPRLPALPNLSCSECAGLRGQKLDRSPSGPAMEMGPIRTLTGKPTVGILGGMGPLATADFF
jgi:hypothetical protein